MPKKRSRGGQRGNKNAVGHGAPKGNQNARKHSAYALPESVLSSEEENILYCFDVDPETNLIEEIRLLKIREYRLMKAIKHYYSVQDDEGNCGLDALILDSSVTVTESREFDNDDDEQAYNNEIRARVERGERLPGRKCVVREARTNATNYIIRLEQEMTTVQRAIVNALVELARYRELRGNVQQATEADDWADLIDDIEQE